MLQKQIIMTMLFFVSMLHIYVALITPALPLHDAEAD